MRTSMALAGAIAVATTATLSFAGQLAQAATGNAAQLDLAQPFHTRSAWGLFVNHGAPTKDYGGNDAPGALKLCLQKGPLGPCVAGPVTNPLSASANSGSTAWEPHYLIAARVVYPRGSAAAPLLLIVTGSLNAGDGDQIVATELVRYVHAQDTFQRVFAGGTGHNNNQEIRFVSAGSLRGSVISAEPEAHRPYGYEMVVNQPDGSGFYRPVLRYHSATIYGDGNQLAVIDSEMPSIEQRLGLWRQGMPLPVPAMGSNRKPCLKLTLKHGELWCE